MRYSIKRKIFSSIEIEEIPELWYEYKNKINPMIDKISNSFNYHVVFCRALDKIEEDPINPGYYLLFDTIPGIKYKDGNYYMMKHGFLGLGKEKLTKVSIKDAEKYLSENFCTTNDPFKLAKDRKVEKIYNSIVSMRKL